MKQLNIAATMSMTDLEVADETKPGGDRSGPRRRLSRFFLVGSERSGSTMFRLMLDHHPELSCMFECDFMVSCFRRCKRGPLSRYADFLQRDWHFQHSGLRFPDNARSYQEVIDAFFEQRSSGSGTTYIGATVHHDFHHLPELFPQAKYVHLLRDGRPVAASVVNMGWAGNLYVGALRWRKAVERVYALQESLPPDRWLEVRYEKLVSDPRRTLEKVCAFLGVVYNDNMLRYNEDSTYGPPKPVNADRWRHRLTPREIYLAEMAGGDLLERAGYDRLFPPAVPSRLERLCIHIHHRIARARFKCKRYGAYLLLVRKLGRAVGIRRAGWERRFEAIRDAHIK